MVGFALATLASLFSVVNPIGAIPVYLSLTATMSKSDRNVTSLMTSLYFVGILLVFFFAGTMILNFFGIQISSMRIAGGIVIFQSGMSLLSGKFAQKRGYDKEVQHEAEAKEDISFSPMAMPMLSGPGSISLLISLYVTNPEPQNRLAIAFVILVLGLLVYLTLRMSPLLFKILGQGGLNAVSRIMGFIVMTIGIQYVIGGLYELIEAMQKS